MHYLDQASTSFPKPKEVVQSICEYLTQCGVSPGRGSYRLAELAEKNVVETREKLSVILQVKQPDHIAFTQNATHSLNIILKGFLQENDHVLICEYSHNAALRPLESLKKSKRISYDVLPVDFDGNIDLADFLRLKKRETRLLVVTGASNVIGVKSKLFPVCDACKEEGIATLIDLTQSLNYVLEQPDADFLVGTGHKTLLGPSGIGFFYAKEPSLIAPPIEGGSPGNSSLSSYHPEQIPYRFEGGTLNSVGISGLLGALTYIERKGSSVIAQEGMSLLGEVWSDLQQIPGIVIYGPKNIENKIPLVSFNLKNWMPQEVAFALDRRFQIATRAGLHCAPLMHKKLKTAPLGTVRASFGHLNNRKSTTALIEALHILSKERNP